LYKKGSAVLPNVIELNNITMNFNLSKEWVHDLKEFTIKFLTRQLSYQEFLALKNVSLSVEKGDVFGIVGRNGSGKSTLLKIVSGILKPTKGTVSVNGSISPLIELGAGFDMDLTARENIYLNGYTLGYTKKLVVDNFDEIVDFAELREFVDVPIKNFSSGMTARLAFSIATIIKPDILIVDEVLSVGDFLFKGKSERKIAELMSGGTTVLLVSHAIQQIEQLCNKAMWIDSGEVKMVGNAKDVCGAYTHGFDKNKTKD
jgi:ABC-2 type transport system ATP-binding protein/lipopolysaccharide transport system ATP-binding protein